MNNYVVLIILFIGVLGLLFSIQRKSLPKKLILNGNATILDLQMPIQHHQPPSLTLRVHIFNEARADSIRRRVFCRALFEWVKGVVVSIEELY